MAHRSLLSHPTSLLCNILFSFFFFFLIYFVQGAVPKTRVAILVKDLISMGCYEVSIADTIGENTIAKSGGFGIHGQRHIYAI